MSELSPLLYAKALRDFQEARRQAALEDLRARLTGKSDDLLSYTGVSRLLKAHGLTNLGVQDIPLDAIVGSVGRYSDFTRTFLPRRATDKDRWAKIKLKATYEGGLPPIEVYKIGEAYFVLDGNHRVSVVRQLGGTHIQANVTEVHTRVPLTADVQPDDLIVKSRYAEFLERTALDLSRPGCDLSVTAPGQYRVLEAQIEKRQRQMETAGGEEVSFQAAAAAWYDTVYLPVRDAIVKTDVLTEFPGRTVTDLYVWLSRRLEALEQELGWHVRPELVASELADNWSPRLQRVLARLGERVRDAVTPAELHDGPAPGQWRRGRGPTHGVNRLFPDILVPISGSERGWFALDQALLVAQRERSALHGFHVVREQADMESDRVELLRERFQERCHQVGVRGHLVVEAGPIARTICQRARWTDLVIANLAYPPGRRPVQRAGSGFRTMIRRCSRPILAVPQVTQLSRALLAYDGSPKAREALFVAAHLAGWWGIPLAVVTVLQEDLTAASMLDEAQSYLEDCGVKASLHEETGAPADAILRLADETQSDLILMGGYGFNPLFEVMLGSALDQLLCQSQVPLLICR